MGDSGGGVEPDGSGFDGGCGVLGGAAVSPGVRSFTALIRNPAIAPCSSHATMSVYSLSRKRVGTSTAVYGPDGVTTGVPKLSKGPDVSSNCFQRSAMPAGFRTLATSSLK